MYFVKIKINLAIPFSQQKNEEDCDTGNFTLTVTFVGFYRITLKSP